MGSGAKGIAPFFLLKRLSLYFHRPLPLASKPGNAFGADRLICPEPVTRQKAMIAYRLLYFRSSVLEDWELLQVDSLMEALQTASARAPDLTVELWSQRKKVAIFRPVRHH